MLPLAPFPADAHVAGGVQGAPTDSFPLLVIILLPPVQCLPQTRVSPEEYKEFLSLGHGEIFGIELDAVVDAPWR